MWILLIELLRLGPSDLPYGYFSRDSDMAFDIWKHIYDTLAHNRVEVNYIPIKENNGLDSHSMIFA